MRNVSIIGAAETNFGILEGKTIRDIMAEAGTKAIEDSGLNSKDIQAFYLGNFAGSNFVGQNHLAPYTASALGLNHIPCTRLEDACASGGVALREGVMAVASGMYDFVLVGGVEKMTSVTTERCTEILSGAADEEFEARVGITFPGLFALMARRHMFEYGTTKKQLSMVAVKNHKNGAKNPYAQMRKEITLEKALNSVVIADPLNLYDCSLVSDGAAAIVLCPANYAHEYSNIPIDVIGFGQSSDVISVSERPSITVLQSTVKASMEAYKMANLKPQDIDVCEVHDCFTISEIIATEDLGFVEKGKGGKAVEEGMTEIDGAIPINPSGGLKAKGHPVGATGASQAVETVFQLRGVAGERQVKNAEIGLIHNLGGSGSTCVVHILKRR